MRENVEHATQTRYNPGDTGWGLVVLQATPGFPPETRTTLRPLAWLKTILILFIACQKHLKHIHYLLVLKTLILISNSVFMKVTKKLTVKNCHGNQKVK